METLYLISQRGGLDLASLTSAKWIKRPPPSSRRPFVFDKSCKIRPQNVSPRVIHTLDFMTEAKMTSTGSPLHWDGDSCLTWQVMSSACPRSESKSPFQKDKTGSLIRSRSAQKAAKRVGRVCRSHRNEALAGRRHARAPWQRLLFDYPSKS